MNRKFLAVVLLVLVAPWPTRAERLAPDDQARFLAGLAVDGTPLQALSAHSAWRAHAAEFDKAWLNIERRQLDKIDDWVPGALGHAATSNEPLFYMFSGPDLLYAYSF